MNTITTEAVSSDVESTAPNSDAGDGLCILGWLFMVIGFCTFFIACFMGTSVDSQGYGAVTNLAKQQTQLLVVIAAAVLTIMGTLFYGFGKVVRQLVRNAPAD